MGGEPTGVRPAGARPRSLKGLAAAFDRLAADVSYKRVDVSTARVILAALDREFRCLELQLRYGAAVTKKTWDGA